MVGLIELDMCGTEVSDVGLSWLKPLDKLEVLSRSSLSWIEAVVADGLAGSQSVWEQAYYWRWCFMADGGSWPSLRQKSNKWVQALTTLTSLELRATSVTSECAQLVCSPTLALKLNDYSSSITGGWYFGVPSFASHEVATILILRTKAQVSTALSTQDWCLNITLCSITLWDSIKLECAISHVATSIPPHHLINHDFSIQEAWWLYFCFSHTYLKAMFILWM